MNIIRKILFPFAILYWIITFIRNVLYDFDILKGYSFSIPIIAVGNLSVGGTGKSPQIEYLIRLLSEKYSVATLSRGYKRKSKGFVLANEHSKVEDLGDEPFQFFSKFKNIQVAVDANRKNGIVQLMAQKNKPEIILLDDAFQHRKVKAGYYILLTTYTDLFCDDFMLPFGNLRESSLGKKRADMIIVTKCPMDISEIAQQKIRTKVKVNVPIFFSAIAYDEKIYSENKALELQKVTNEELFAVAGIAKPKPFFNFLNVSEKNTMVFPDHHSFDEKDVEDIMENAQNKIIITTEKDYVRLKGMIQSDQLYFLPIQSKILTNQNEFDKNILDYVGKSSRNSNFH